MLQDEGKKTKMHRPLPNCYRPITTVRDIVYLLVDSYLFVAYSLVVVVQSFIKDKIVTLFSIWEIFFASIYCAIWGECIQTVLFP